MPSGYLGGRYDLVVQRFVDGWMAFPGLLVLLTVMSIVGRGTLQIIVVLGGLYGIHNSRVLRSAVTASRRTTTSRRRRRRRRSATAGCAPCCATCCRRVRVVRSPIACATRWRGST